MQVLQIIPKLPPAIDGLGDYSLNLARQFRKDFGIETCFVVGNPGWSGAKDIEGFPVLQVKEQSPTSLCNLLSSHPYVPVLLHYVGYGYAKRGCPLWLTDGLRYWQAHCPKSRLITMFHEVYASGAPWTSSFWLSPLQKHIAGQLVKMSDRVLTSNQCMAEILTQISTHKNISVSTMPIFSTIGESESLPKLSERKHQLVVFGSRSSRLQIYQKCQTVIDQICYALKIENICDVGASIDLDLSSCIGVPIIEKGITNSSEIRNILTNSVAGFLNFPPPRYLAKSSIFAAYCAHGVIPCMVDFSLDPFDGLISGEHYWSAAAGDLLNLHVGQAIANQACKWYQNHNLSSQVTLFSSQLLR